MKTATQPFGPPGLVPPSKLSPRNGPASWAGRNRRGPFAWVALLAGLCLLLFSAPQSRAQGIPPGCSGSAIGISLFTSAPDVHVGDTLFYSLSVYNGIAGNPTSCDASNIVATLTTPDGIVHPITLVRTYLSHAQSDFYTNIVSYVARAQDIRPDGTLRATAEDTAVIFQNDTPSNGGANQGVNTEVSLPCIQIAVQCVGSVGENGAITFTGTVTNCGNNTLVGVTVTNYVNGGAFAVVFPTNILRGQSVNFTGSYIPINPCVPSTAVLVAVGRDQFTANPRTVTSTNTTTCSEVLTPGIKVTKTCPIGPTAPGQLLVFSGSVSNTGNVTLTNVLVVNNQPAANTLVISVASLAPGAVTNFTGSYLAPTNCSVSDTLVATATSRCGVAVTDTATATCPITTTPAIKVTEFCPVTPGVSGGNSSYSGVVSNSGNITLNNIVVVSDRPVANTVVFTAVSMAPGASANYSGTFVVPFNVCTVTTGVRATGNDACTGTPVTNTASATCPITTAPALSVTLQCPVTLSSNGGPITYTGTVLNSGNVTLNNVVVTDSQSSPPTVLTVATLLPGASANFTASFIAPTNVCSVSSTVIATGSDNCSQVVVSNSASATCTLATTPAIVITQICPVSPAVPGGLFTYTGTVRNAGNISLTNVVVLNNLSGATPVITIALLAPGAVASFSGSYVAPANCFTTSTSTATGRSICGVSVTNTVTVTCAILTTPAIVVRMNCPATPPPLGGTLVYSGTVSNSGNITLSNVVVLNSRSGATPIFTIATLAPGAVASFTGSFLVPPNCCIVSSILTASGQGCDGRVVTDTASSTCPVLTAPAIVVTKVCTGGPVAPGQLLTYSGIVSNAGNVSLTDVYIVNSVPTNNSPVLGPVTLAPGDYMTYTASYIVPTDFCGTDTVTVRGTACGRTVTNSVTSSCPILSSPALTLTKNCPVSPPPRGGLFIYTGTVRNTGNITLINVFVTSNEPVPNTPVLGPITLAPGASSNFTASFIAPSDCCEVPTTLNAHGQDKCSLTTVTARVSDVCPLLTTPGISVIQTCPSPTQQIGSVFQFTGMVSNTGNINLTNVLVFGNQPSNTFVLGPIELAPGEAEVFSGSYIIAGGSNTVIVTNTISTITTNAPGSVTTNAATAVTFVTVDSISQSVVDRFGIGTNFSGVTYAGEDHGYGATMLYAMRKATTGTSFFDTIIPSTATTTDRFDASTRNFDALAYAAPDVGYGPVIFYYLSHDLGGVSSFGTIAPGGVVGVVTDRFVVGSKFDALTFVGADLGYGANMFYYVRHDASGLSTFGTINPALPGTVTDRFTIGTNVEALVFTSLVAPGYGPDNFYYVRRGASGISTFGTIFITSPTTAQVTDRFTVGTDAAELTFSPTDVGFGANLFYILRGKGGSVVTNLVTTYTTNTTTSYTTNQVRFTTPNIVTATGTDVCQGRTVIAQASCSDQPNSVIGGAGVPPSSYSNGTYRLSFATQSGMSYTIQYKNALTDAAWTNLQTITGTGGNVTITDDSGVRSMRFYRIISP